jgi:ABC-type branched-subunit amino acid transport system ATPase component
VPEERGIYATLTVAENLALPPVIDSKCAWPIDKIYDLFPILREREVAHSARRFRAASSRCSRSRGCSATARA